jgi:hypothetical protein
MVTNETRLQRGCRRGAWLVDRLLTDMREERMGLNVGQPRSFAELDCSHSEYLGRDLDLNVRTNSASALGDQLGVPPLQSVARVHGAQPGAGNDPDLKT